MEAAPGAKYKAAFSVAYGAGLRVSEVANLKVTDNGVGLPLHDSMDDVELDHLEIECRGRSQLRINRD